MKRASVLCWKGWKNGAEEIQARGALKFGKEEENIGWSVVQMMLVGICYARKGLGGKEVLSSIPRR